MTSRGIEPTIIGLKVLLLNHLEDEAEIRFLNRIGKLFELSTRSYLLSLFKFLANRVNLSLTTFALVSFQSQVQL